MMVADGLRPGPDRHGEPRGARRRLAALAGHHGDGPGARRLLQDPDPGVRATALGALQRAGALTEADLAAAIVDAAAAVRRRGAEILADASSSETFAAVSLLGLLADDDASVVETAAWASGERQPTEPGAVARLAVLATGHEDSLVREAAVAALGAIGDPAGLPAILAGTTDKATVRRRAVLALAPFAGADVDVALRRALADRDAQVRQAAEDLTTG